MNIPDRRPPPEVPSDAMARIESARLRAEKELTGRLDTFWQNCPASRTKRVSPKDLVPLFQEYAGTLFDVHAKEYLTLFDDAQSLEDFLHWKLPEVVAEEILPPTGGSKPPGSSDVIGLLETLGEYKDRVDAVFLSAKSSKSKEIWEYPDRSRFDESADEIWRGKRAKLLAIILASQNRRGLGKN
jgi:hypothetical protein